MLTAYTGALNLGPKSNGMVYCNEMFWQTTRTDTIYMAELAAIQDFLLDTIVDLGKTDEIIHFITSNPVIQSHLSGQSTPNKPDGMRVYREIMGWCEQYQLELETEWVKSNFNSAHKRLKTNRYLSAKSERYNSRQNTQAQPSKIFT